MIRPGIEQQGAWLLEVAQHQLVSFKVIKQNKNHHLYNCGYSNPIIQSCQDELRIK